MRSEAEIREWLEERKAWEMRFEQMQEEMEESLTATTGALEVLEDLKRFLDGDDSA